MSVSRAFDLAQFVNTPANVNDGALVSALGPPFTAAFKPVVTSASSGVTVGSSIPVATAPNQVLLSGAGPGYAWGLGVQPGPGGGIPEAPVDGLVYGRQSGSWSVVAGGGGGITDAPKDGTAYVRQDGVWTNIFDAGTF